MKGKIPRWLRYAVVFAPVIALVAMAENRDALIAFTLSVGGFLVAVFVIPPAIEWWLE